MRRLVMRRNELPDFCLSTLPSSGQLIILRKGECGYGAHGDRAAYACGARSRERKLLHESSLFHEIRIGNKTGAH